MGGEGGEEAAAVLGGGGEVDDVAELFFPTAFDDGGFQEVAVGVGQGFGTLQAVGYAVVGLLGDEVPEAEVAPEVGEGPAVGDAGEELLGDGFPALAFDGGDALFFCLLGLALGGVLVCGCGLLAVSPVAEFLAAVFVLAATPVDVGGVLGQRAGVGL